MLCDEVEVCYVAWRDEITPPSLSNSARLFQTEVISQYLFGV
jgi:hypothetical protein